MVKKNCDDEDYSGRGTRRKLSTEDFVIAEITRQARCGMSQKSIARKLGFAIASFNKNPGFSSAYWNAKYEANMEVADSMFVKAKEGDFNAMKWWLSVHNYQRDVGKEGREIPIEGITGSISEKSTKINDLVSAGLISASHAKALLDNLKSEAQIIEIYELQKRVEELEERIKK